MNRVAFTLITGRSWTGGYHYLSNLIRILAEHETDRVQPVLFVGTDADEGALAPFCAIPSAEVVRTPEFDDQRKRRRLYEALLVGCDRAAVDCFRRHRIDVVFEYTQFYGWRFPLPVVAWLTDFQHRHLKNLFSARAYWKRDLGFRAQVLSGRSIMLSSEASRRDCETFLPGTIGRTSVVHFAVPPPDRSDYQTVRKIADSYQLPEHFFYLPNQFWMHKNHPIVIKALHLARQQGHQLVVAASGEPADYRHPGYYKTLESLVGSFRLEQNFRFLGMIPRLHVFALMRTSTALINPSLSEGWSTSVEEAKSLGVPLLLSSLPVHREQAGNLAQYFDPQSADELASLMARHRSSPASSRRAVEEWAIAESPNRVKQFGNDFSNIVERAAASFRARA